MLVIKLDSIATRTKRANGTLLPKAELQVYVPYGAPGNGWFAGAFSIPTFDIFSLRSMIRTVKSS